MDALVDAALVHVVDDGRQKRLYYNAVPLQELYVLEFEPPHRYAHSFKFTSYDDPAGMVLHEVEDLGDGTVEYRMTCSNMVREPGAPSR